MTEVLQPLVLTPWPMPTESMMGLILRTSEFNGYESPNVILRYAGMTENEIRSAKPPIDKLAVLYGRDPDDFCYMGHKSTDRARHRKQWRILNQPVPALYVSIKAAKICPECIMEEKFVDGFWDLRHAVACSTHARMAITSCPACGKSLTWHRQGLLMCRCGNNLSGLRGEPVEDAAVLDMLELIKRKLHDDPINTVQLRERGFPLQEIGKISIGTLLGIIGRLQPGNRRKTLFNIPSGVSVEFNAIKLASGMLANWPNGLYDFLEATYQTNPDISGSTLHKQFHRFCCSFFRSGLPEVEIEFLRKAFLDFGNDRWKTKGFIDPRFSHRLRTPSTIVGMKGLAEHLGIMVPTAENYVRKGIIQGKLVKTAKSTRMIFDLTQLPFRKAEGKRHTTRYAAKFLGIPVKLLALLRQNGAYKVKRLAWGRDGYSELDLIDFRDHLIGLTPTGIEFDPEIHISMGQLFRKKLGGQGIPAKIIAELMEGKLETAGRKGVEVSDLFFLRRNVLPEKPQ